MMDPSYFEVLHDLTQFLQSPIFSPCDQLDEHVLGISCIQLGRSLRWVCVCVSLSPQHMLQKDRQNNMHMTHCFQKVATSTIYSSSDSFMKFTEVYCHPYASDAGNLVYGRWIP